jgi:sortase A
MRSGLERLFDGTARRLDGALPATETLRARTRRPDPWVGWDREDVAFWRGLKEGDVFARMVSPRMKLDMAVVKGISVNDLKKGPGWMPDSAMPGREGNTVVSGHRTTWLAPYANIDDLRAGDEIRLESPFRVYTYRVFRKVVVDPDDRGVTAFTKPPTLTLSACHPPYSARYRIIVQARLAKVVRRVAADDRK